MLIEWDDRKAESNEEKHGISFEEGATVLRDPLAATIPDDSSGEDRWVTIGRSCLGKTLVIVYTEQQDVIRIISAREATPKEREEYEEGI